ncbi:sulfurtransferase TusA family protein [Anaerovorax odorimutans]|uniref:Sulfurtransferase TusA family protein n=1 Tax=Anaerovorax odorimutans TaxID=109327 RepID=A0ABT1RKA7_9FIRM|nr:sulfurtransferase TusA family protein [Anaerovorax odorimutans]MCQ4635396.1 sulfurtransferase TusA family protein [Anaerovorax odorimutans]
MKEKRLDCLGEACPIPLMKTEKKLAALKKGDILIVEVDHNCAIRNIPEWAEKKGYDCQVKEVCAGQWNIVLKKN